MRAWIEMLGGLIVWAAHFFALYGIASILPGTVMARWLTVAATLVAFGIAAWVLWRALANQRRVGSDNLGRWMAGVAAAGSGIALVAIIYQGMPALLA